MSLKCRFHGSPQYWGSLTIGASGSVAALGAELSGEATATSSAVVHAVQREEAQVEQQMGA